MVVGCPGSGKSTLARRLGKQLGLPVIHLDKLFWLPGWEEIDLASFDVRLAEALEAEAWVVDGHYGRTLGMRLERADTVIWLDRPRLTCLCRILRRVAISH